MLAEPIGNKKYQLFCTKCRQKIDIVSREEFVGLVKMGENPLCSGCDKVRQDEVPHQLLDGTGEPYILWIGGRPHLIDVWGEASERLKAFVAGMQDMTDASMWKDDLPCLSNSSNLISEHKNDR